MKKIAALICFLIIACIPLSVHASGSIYADTAFVGTTQAEQNETFSMNINLIITDAEIFSPQAKVDGMHFQLGYDKSKLELVKIEGINGWTIKDSDEYTGYMCVTETDLTRTSREICKITFKALSISTSTVKLFSAISGNEDEAYTPALNGWVNVCATNVKVVAATPKPSSAAPSVAQSSTPAVSSAAPSSEPVSSVVSEDVSSTDESDADSSADASSDESSVPAVSASTDDNDSGTFPYLWIIVIAAVLVAGAGVGIFFLVKRKPALPESGAESEAEPESDSDTDSE